MGIASDLAPTGVLRASINLGNPVLAQGTPEAPSGVTVDLARVEGDRIAEHWGVFDMGSMMRQLGASPS